MKELEYRIANLSTLQYATFEAVFDPEIKEMKIESTYSYGIQVDGCLFAIKMETVFSQNENIVVKIETEMVFQFNQEGFESFIGDNNFIMSEEYVRDFTSMLYSSTRGILASKTEYSAFPKLILPPISMDNIVKSPLKISIES